MDSYFTPISVQGKSFDNSFIRRKRYPFNDRRLHSTWSLLSQRLVNKQKRVVQQISNTSSEAAQFYRFYGNKRVSQEELIKMNCTIKPEILEGRHILCIGDSTSFNMKKRLNKIKDAGKLGVLQDGKTPGFFGHVNLAVEAQTMNVLGLADILYWNRPKGEAPTKYGSTPIKDKESYKWFMGAANAKAALQSASGLSYLFDREADSFELFDYLQNELESDFVIRGQHNRKIEWKGQELFLNACLDQSALADTYEIDLPALDHYSRTAGKRIRRKARKAKIEVRFESVQIQAPKNVKTSKPLSLYIVEAKEITSGLPKGEKPLRWRLWTTHPIHNADGARLIIKYYLNRWIVEQLFRTIKKKGFDEEDTELESLDGILKETSMVLKAATTVLQLVYARNKFDAQPIEDVFDEKEIQVLDKVKERFEGKTEKQKNPFPPDKLSWAAWIIARLGGWKGYQSQKPPGPITMKRGLDKFKTFCEAYQLFNTS